MAENKTLEKGACLYMALLHHPGWYGVEEIKRLAGDDRHPANVTKDLRTMVGVGLLDERERRWRVSVQAMEWLKTYVDHERQQLNEMQRKAAESFGIITRLTGQEDV
jgi:predicted transcriptional regulator